MQVSNDLIPMNNDPKLINALFSMHLHPKSTPMNNAPNRGEYGACSNK